MLSGSLNIQLQCAGVSVSVNMTRTGDGGIPIEATIPVAKTVGAWVKIDANTAAGTLTTGHGWTSGTYDVYWTGGVRYDMAVTITGDALALDGGTGTDFPASANTTVVLSRQTAVNVAIDGDALSVIGLNLEYADGVAGSGRVLFEDASGDDIYDLPLVGNLGRIWDIFAGDDNPFSGDPIVSAKVSQSNTTVAPTFKLAGLVDATP